MENDKLIRRRQLLELIGMSHTTQWRLERAGRFPARVRIGAGSVGWHLAEVEEWVREREKGVGPSKGNSSKRDEPVSAFPRGGNR